MADSAPALVERLYRCFNRRDEECLAELCDERMEFFPGGLREYVGDIAEAWEELRISAGEVEVRGEEVLVRGRVYARSRELGIRDVPVAWIWRLRDGRFAWGEVFLDPADGVARFAA